MDCVDSTLETCDESLYERVRGAANSLCLERVLTQNYLQAHMIEPIF